MTRGWTARSLGSAFQHRFFYTLIRFWGRKGAYLVLRPVVAWYVLFSPLVRARAGYYLDRRFPGASPWRRLGNTYRMCLGLGEVLVDRAVLGILGPDHLTCNLSGRETLKALLDEGHGLILLTAHVGCWQLGMASLAKLDSAVSLLIHREEGDVDRHFFEHGRQDAPYRIIDPTGYLGGTLEMMQVLKNGEALCIMGDRLLGGSGTRVEVDFLGGKVALPFSPYKIASASGAPIAIIFPYKGPGDTYALEVARVIRVPALHGRKPATYLPFAFQYAEAMEAFVQKHPFQFFNFFDMWAEPSASAAPTT
jgi:predicted LPLAT superfamily acyltransferase